MKKLMYFACLCCVLVGLSSCDKKKEDVTDEITVYGNVIDKTTGQPLYNVLIQEKNKVGGSTVTGNDGNYELKLPITDNSRETYVLVASKENYQSSEYELSLSKVDKSRHIKIDFQLAKNVIYYYGVVTDDKTGKPLAGAEVYESHSLIGRCYTNEKGEYNLELGPMPGYQNYSSWYHTISVNKNGYDCMYKGRTFYHTDNDFGKKYELNFVISPEE